MPWQAVLTKKAAAACDGKRNYNAVAFSDVSHFGPGLFDDAHELVTHDHVFELRKETVVDVQVRPTNCCGSHTQNRVARMLDFWICHIVHFNVAGTMKYNSFHVRSY